MIRALIVDGLDEIRRGLQMRLAIEPDMTIVGATGTAGEALYMAQTLDPDVIVVDTGMGGAEGVALVECLRAAAPTPALVVLDLHGDMNTRALAKEAGAQAFVEKCGEGAELLSAIRQLAPRQMHEIDRESTDVLTAQRPRAGGTWNKSTNSASQMQHSIAVSNR